MKIGSTTLFTVLVTASASASAAAASAPAADDTAPNSNNASSEQRDLQQDCSDRDTAWRPNYNTPWSDATCSINRNCNWSGFTTQLACCKGIYAGQPTGACFADLPNPPTTSPTPEGGAEFYYPMYEETWSEGYCSNELPLPFNNINDRPNYSSMLACCKGAYAGQMSGVCLGMLPNPPTLSPTEEDVDWYPDYDTDWQFATCKNERRPDARPGDRPKFETQLECCKRSYGGQVSGACLSALPNPPTLSPTEEFTNWYPDYDTDWQFATCKNERRPDARPGDRPTFDTQLECCKRSYGGQMSGACLSALPNPPTLSPTEEFTNWYPDYDTDWQFATCKNERRPDARPGDRPTFDTQLECCKRSYGGQMSGACLSALPNPPTTSPTTEEGLWYPDRNQPQTSATCSNAYPTNTNEGTYDSQEDCCKARYASQTSDACMCDVDPCHSCKCFDIPSARQKIIDNVNAMLGQKNPPQSFADLVFENDEFFFKLYCTNPTSFDGNADFAAAGGGTNPDLTFDECCVKQTYSGSPTFDTCMCKSEPCHNCGCFPSTSANLQGTSDLYDFNDVCENGPGFVTNPNLPVCYDSPTKQPTPPPTRQPTDPPARRRLGANNPSE